MSCGNYSVSRFHFTTGKPYTRKITSEMNSSRVCQNSNNHLALRLWVFRRKLKTQDILFSNFARNYLDVLIC